MKEQDNHNVSSAFSRGPIFNRNLWLLTGGQVFQVIGDHSLTVAISAYTYGMTGSTWAFALQQLVMYLPWLLFSAVAGPLVDHADRRKVMIAADMTRGLVCLAYPLCRSLEPILLLNFIGSTARVFSMTARTALIPRLCPKESLLTVNGIRASVLGVVDLTVPTIAGVIIAKIGAVTAFPFTTVAAAVGASLYTQIAPNVGRAPVVGHGQSSDDSLRTVPRTGRRKSLGEALDLIRSDRALMGLILIYCAYGAGQHGVNAIFYPFLDSVLRAGPAVFGLSVSLYFGSGLAAGVLLAKYGRIVRRIPPVAVAALSAVSWITHSFVRLVPVSLALDVIDGLGMFILTNLLTSEVQSRSPADMTGRVWGLTQTLTSTSEVLGVLAAGTIGERWGPAFAFRAAGLAGLAAVTAAFLTSRAAARGRPRPTEARG